MRKVQMMSQLLIKILCLKKRKLKRKLFKILKKVVYLMILEAKMMIINLRRMKLNNLNLKFNQKQKVRLPYKINKKLKKKLKRLINTNKIKMMMTIIIEESAICLMIKKVMKKNIHRKSRLSQNKLLLRKRCTMMMTRMMNMFQNLQLMKLLKMQHLKKTKMTMTMKNQFLLKTLLQNIKEKAYSTIITIATMNMYQPRIIRNSWSKHKKQLKNKNKNKQQKKRKKSNSKLLNTTKEGIKEIFLMTLTIILKTRRKKKKQNINHKLQHKLKLKKLKLSMIKVKVMKIILQIMTMFHILITKQKKKL